MSDFSLTCHQLGVAIPGAPPLREIDLRLSTRSCLGLVGRSGAGKSTLARALVGLVPQLRGSLRVGDGGGEHELVGAPPRAWQRLRRRVQLCWQDARGALDPRLTVAAVLAEPRTLLHLPPLDPRATRELLAGVGLDEELLSRTPEGLSGGECQRLGLARALAAEPSLLIADEITSALDRPLAWQIVDLLARVHARGVGLVVISHDLALLSPLVDEIVVLEQGRVVERGHWREVIDAPRHAATRALAAAVERLADPPAPARAQLEEPEA